MLKELTDSEAAFFAFLSRCGNCHKQNPRTKGVGRNIALLMSNVYQEAQHWRPKSGTITITLHARAAK